MTSYQNNKYTSGNSGQKGSGSSPQRYGNLGTGTFTPRKPVHSFRDLDIYQRTLECSVLIVKDLVPVLKKLKYAFEENMVNCAMSVPLFISEAHSLRFASFEGGVMLLEKSMSGCNKMIVYLEQIKGVYGSKVDVDLIDDLINRYADSRTKSFHLEKSWKRFKTGEVGSSAQRNGNIGTGTTNFKY